MGASDIGWPILLGQFCLLGFNISRVKLMTAFELCIEIIAVNVFLSKLLDLYQLCVFYLSLSTRSLERGLKWHMVVARWLSAGPATSLQ